MSSTQIRIETLSKDNYDTWKLQVEAILIKNNAWSYVSGSKLRPSIVDGAEASIKEAEEWDANDRKARSDLILAITPSELKNIKHCQTSREIWIKLEKIYQSKGPARKATLLKQLTLNKMKEGDNLHDHISKFFDAVDKLEDMDLKINDELLTIMLLYSLPESFENFRCAIESRDELPKPEALKIKIYEEYDARKNKEDSVIPNAMYIENKRNNKNVNVYREKSYEKKKYENKKIQFKFKCHFCGKFGHKAAECYFKNKSKNQHAGKVENEALTLSSTNYEIEETLLKAQTENENDWCLDSGATSHMSSERKCFENFKEVENKLKLANKEYTKILGMGEVKMKVNKGKSEKNFTLKNVLHVPDLRTNLMSVAKITNNGNSVIFNQSKALMLKPNGTVIPLADRKGDLYFIRNKSESAKTICSRSQHMSKLEEWHCKFGHLNIQCLNEMAKNNLVHGLKLNKNKEMEICEICIKGKLSKKPFPNSCTERNTELLELIHTDVCGPMKTQSIGGAKYFITFIDDKSRYCEIFFMKTKNEAFKYFKIFKNNAELQIGKKIKFLQSDNGTEYVNKEFNQFLEENGIKRRLTIPQTPEQNGIAERKNRSIVEMARCMMLQSKLAPFFWAEAVSTANYIRNRCSSRSINNEIPYTKWTNKKPTVKYFQIFGMKGLMLDTDHSKEKFDSKCKECIFLGYSNESKAYRLWLPKEKKIARSRNVKFLNKFDLKEDFEDFVDEVEDSSEDNKLFVNMIKNNEISEHLNQTKEVNEGSTHEIPQQNISEKRKRGRPRKNKNEQANLIMPDPVNVKEAFASEYAQDWKMAIKNEYIAHIKNETWEIVDHPENREIIGSKLVLKTKYNQHGDIQKRKARLVAKGYAQQPGLDYNETYAPVIRISSLRLLMAISTRMNLIVHQMDVVTAYLNGYLEENIYMDIPDELEDILKEIIKNKEENNNIKILETAKKWLKDLENGNSKVCHMKKALYGLKQSGRQWYKKLDEELQKLDMKPLNADPCFYMKRKKEDIIFITIYVDDIIIATNNIEWLKELKINLNKRFDMKDLDKIHYCLGIEFKQNDNDGSIKMVQKQYIENILKRFGMEEAKSITTPVDPNNKLSSPENTNLEEMKKYPYQNLIGSLMYLATSTRPDISYVTSYLSQFNTNYNVEHWQAAKRVLRYLSGTKNHGLHFKKSVTNLKCFVDADWGGCINDRRSYTGYVCIFSNSAICWESRKQRTVALSSMEAEYMALTEATKQAIYMKNFLNEIGISTNHVEVFNDNQSAQKLVKNPIFHSRTKHIDIRHHFVRNAYKDNIINLIYTETSEMPADILTKGLQNMKHEKCMKSIGICNIEEQN